jgi:hypothetical protein
MPTIQVLVRAALARTDAKDPGAAARFLRWEQLAGRPAVAPLRRLTLPRRGQPVETDTLIDTYPFRSAPPSWRACAVWRGRLGPGRV